MRIGSVTSAFFLATIMVLVPMSTMVSYQKDAMNNSLVDESKIRADTSAGPIPLHVDQFVESAKFFSTKRPIDVAIGYYHACFLFDDGRLSCSGYNYQGQLELVNHHSLLTMNQHLCP